MVASMSIEVPVLQIRPRGAGVWVAVGVNLLIAALGAVFVVRGVTSHQGVLCAVGVILFVPLVLIGLFAASGELTSTALTIRAGVLRRRVIPLSRVVDAGMLYTVQPRISCWLPYVWLDDGSAVHLPIGGHAGHSPLGHGVGGDPEEFWSELAATPQGALCIAILTRAARVGSRHHGGTGEPPTGGRLKEVAFWPATRPARPATGGIDWVPGSGVVPIPARYRADTAGTRSAGRRWRRRILFVVVPLLLVGFVIVVWRADSTASLAAIVRAETPGVVTGGGRINGRCTRCTTTEFVITSPDVYATQHNLAGRLAAAKLTATTYGGDPAYYSSDHDTWVSWTAIGYPATLPRGTVTVDIIQPYQ